jgi:hypothetical protein
MPTACVQNFSSTFGVGETSSESTQAIGPEIHNLKVLTMQAGMAIGKGGLSPTTSEPSFVLDVLEASESSDHRNSLSRHHEDAVRCSGSVTLNGTSPCRYCSRITSVELLYFLLNYPNDIEVSPSILCTTSVMSELNSRLVVYEQEVTLAGSNNA